MSNMVVIDQVDHLSFIDISRIGFGVEDPIDISFVSHPMVILLPVPSGVIFGIGCTGEELFRFLIFRDLPIMLKNIAMCVLFHGWFIPNSFVLKFDSL